MTPESVTSFSSVREKGVKVTEIRHRVYGLRGHLRNMGDLSLLPDIETNRKFYNSFPSKPICHISIAGFPITCCSSKLDMERSSPDR